MENKINRTGPAWPVEPPGPGCVLYLPGMPGAGTSIYDRSPYGNKGTITGAAWTRTVGGLWCLNFDGVDDQVNCGAGNSLDLTNSFTLSCWLHGSTGGLVMGHFTTWVLAGFALETIDTTNMRLSVGRTVGGRLEWTVNGAWDSGVYTHSVWTNSGVTLSCYRDGVLVSSRAITAINSAAGQPFLIGSGNTGWGNRLFAGKIVLPQVSNRALTAFEIQNIYHREKTLVRGY